MERLAPELSSPATRLLSFRRERLVTTAGLLIAEDRATHALVQRIVRLTVPDDLFSKASGFGRVYYDEQGSYRWITVHPGDSEEGHPVKIRESKTEKGTWHIVAGAGGKLNYMRLTGVKSPEEYRQQAQEKRAARKQAESAQRDVERERKGKLSPEDRAKEVEAAKQQTTQQREREVKTRERERQLIDRVAQAAGWPEDAYRFDATRERLQRAHATPERIEQLEDAHHKQVFARARAVLKASKQQIVDARDERLGAFPIETADPDKVGLTDILEGPATPRGKGFKSITRQSSDREIRSALAGADVAGLERELATATEEARALGSPESRARVEDLAAQVRTAQLVHQAESMPPEAIDARLGEIGRAAQDVRREQADYVPRLQELRTAGDASAERTTLEHRLLTDQARLDNLKREKLEVTVLAGGADTAVKGEQRTLAARRQTEREAEIRHESGDEGVAAYRSMLERMTAARERYANEMRFYRETGVLQRPNLATKPITDPQAVLEMIAADKGIAQMRRDLKRKVDDERLFGKGYFTDVGDVTPEAVAKAERAIESEVAERRTRAFLDKVESPELLLGRGKVFTDEQDPVALHHALDRHLSAGAFNALNNAALAATKTPILSREVVDVLGAPGAAQLLAHTLRQSESPDVIRHIRDGLGDYHLSQNVLQAEERVREMEDALDRADEALASITDPSDLVAAAEANEQRRKAIEEARQVMGQSLGEYEATAALVMALGEGDRKEIHASLGPVGAETAIRQARSLGLGRHDYEITADGTNHFLTVKARGFDKLLARKPDPDLEKLTDDVLAIKRGEQDEEGWVPKGAIVRPQSSFTAKGLEPPSLTAGLKTYNEFGDSGNPGRDLEEHIALRAANGENLNAILGDVNGSMGLVPAEHREEVQRTLSRIFPTTEPLTENGKAVYARDKDGAVMRDAEGKPVQQVRRLKGSDHTARVAKLIDEHFTRAGLPRAAAINGQSLKTDDPKTFDAVHRALAADPRAMVAFSPLGDLTRQDQRSLRHYFLSNVAKTDAKQGVDHAAIERELQELGPEPHTKSERDMFGGETPSSEWATWKQRHDAILADAHGATEAPTSTSWDEYLGAMGGRSKAYRALQDRMKSDFIGRFHTAYTTLHGEPLRLGSQDMAHGELHAGFLNPKLREQLRAARRQDLDAARTRDHGQYAAGSARERIERGERQKVYEEQNQLGMYGARGRLEESHGLKAHQRFTLGAQAEGQLASLMPQIARNFRQDRPIKLPPDATYDGKYVLQQRAIKAAVRAGRIVMAPGTGGGKSRIAIAALSHLRETEGSGVKRGLFLTPSVVQDQFGGEFARFAEPGKLNWAANAGGDHGQRMREHQDAGTHGVVHTHQGFRDDMVKLLGEHFGTNDAGTTSRFMGLSRADAAKVLKEVWQKHGIDYQMLTVDEGHGLLDRDGKPDSLLSRIVQAASDTTPRYMSMSADPIKNDISELRSQLDKLQPDGRFSDAAAWHRQYGVNTTASAEAIKRLVAPYIFAASVPTGNQVQRRRETVNLHPEQMRAYAAVTEAAAKLKAARGRGAVDVAAAKVLAPERFAAAPASEHERIAGEVARNLGMARDHALTRVVDRAPPESNAKLQWIVQHLAQHPSRDKPVVIFARHRQSVADLAEALKASGHRVETITGADSGQERARKKERFQPESGDPEADVMICSDAAEAGLNLQRGQKLIQYDRPATAKTHAQRNGRIDRFGRQNPDLDLVDLTTNTAHEARAQRRIEAKYDLRDILTDPAEMIDDTGVAHVISEARRRAAEERIAA